MFLQCQAEALSAHKRRHHRRVKEDKRHLCAWGTCTFATSRTATLRYHREHMHDPVTHALVCKKGGCTFTTVDYAALKTHIVRTECASGGHLAPPGTPHLPAQGSNVLRA